MTSICLGARSPISLFTRKVPTDKIVKYRCLTDNISVKLANNAAKNFCKNISSPDKNPNGFAKKFRVRQDKNGVKGGQYFIIPFNNPEFSECYIKYSLRY